MLQTAGDAKWKTSVSGGDVRERRSTSCSPLGSASDNARESHGSRSARWTIVSPRRVIWSICFTECVRTRDQKNWIGDLFFFSTEIVQCTDVPWEINTLNDTCSRFAKVSERNRKRYARHFDDLWTSCAGMACHARRELLLPRLQHFLSFRVYLNKNLNNTKYILQ